MKIDTLKDTKGQKRWNV